MRKLNLTLLIAAFAFVSVFISAGGGSTGFQPVITAVKPQSVSYGQTATIYLDVKDLRSSLVVETNKGLSNLLGTLAMARTNVPNSATSEFYINLVGNLSLDYKNEANPGYAVFGKVVQGMEVVDAIAAEPTGVFKGYADVPLADISITMALQSK
jgi:cyclophilin family peptidyl-prolyl cis-trans isomerase